VYPYIIQTDHGLNGYRYHPIVFSINIGNISHDIRYYRAHIVSDISKPDMILLICFGNGQYLKS